MDYHPDYDTGNYGGYGPGAPQAPQGPPNPTNPYGSYGPASDVYGMNQDQGDQGYDDQTPGGGRAMSYMDQSMNQGDRQIDDTRSQRSGAGSERFKQFTETSKERVGCIDAENGIAPRRCTDCICLFIFLFYVLGMFVLVEVAKNRTIGVRQWGDIRRLTHGHDYSGRLCGVDPGVEDKAFLFWCRNSASETGPVKELNLEFPSCVSSCPYNSSLWTTPCLFHQGYSQANIHGGLLGTVETYHVQFQQSIALTHGYDTMAFGGRFCLPMDSTNRAAVLRGPLMWSRLRYIAGSLEDPWFVVFQACVLAVLLGYAFLFIIKQVPKTFVIVFLYVTWVLLIIAGLFFAYAIIGLLGTKTNNAALLEKAQFANYMSYNPLYDKYMPEVATLLSVICAVVIWFLSCSVVGVITHVGGSGFDYVPDLVDAAAECWTAMHSMLIPPALEALLKFFLTWILAYNFMYLASVGLYEERRLLVNGKYYKDEAALFHFDFSVLPWMLYYIFGWVWIMELTTAFGQFLISFSVISWYFIKKEGVRKTGVPPMAPFYAAVDGAFYHVGSLCLGAAIIPWCRLIRLFLWVEDEIVPNEDAQCCAGEGCVSSTINSLCKCIGGCCSKITNARKGCQPACCQITASGTSEGKDLYITTGCAFRYMKNAYNDVIIRSQHFMQASQRSFLLINRYDSTKLYLLEGKGCQVVTVVGVVSIGCICMIYSYLVMMNMPSLRDPTGDNFVAEPMGIAVMIFFLCGSIGYSFMALFDHTAETLLYCYAWNKKFHKDSSGSPVDDYLPESLRDLVDADIDVDEGYCLYGQANPQMYLHTWLPRRKQVKEDKMNAKERTTGSSTASRATGRDPSQGASMSQYSYQGGMQQSYQGGTQQSYQAVPMGQQVQGNQQQSLGGTNPGGDYWPDPGYGSPTSYGNGNFGPNPGYGQS